MVDFDAVLRCGLQHLLDQDPNLRPVVQLMKLQEALETAGDLRQITLSNEGLAGHLIVMIDAACQGAFLPLRRRRFVDDLNSILMLPDFLCLRHSKPDLLPPFF